LRRWRYRADHHLEGNFFSVREALGEAARLATPTL
jgi:hypothetical protein